MDRYFLVFILIFVGLESSFSRTGGRDVCNNGASSREIENVTAVRVNCFEHLLAPIGTRAIDELVNESTVCECLRTNPLVGADFRSREARRPPLVNWIPMSAHQQENAVDAQNTMLDYFRNGMLLQAGLLTDDPNTRTALIRDYNPDYITTAASRPLAAIQATLITSERLAVPEANRDMFSNNVTGDDCVSMREFLAFRQFPTADSVYNDFASLNYQESDWDIRALQDQFVRLHVNNFDMDEQPAPNEPQNMRQARRIWARMAFLNANPLYRNLFSDHDADNEILLDQKKRELFSILKSHLAFTPAQCQATGNCLLAFMGSSRLSDLREKAADFFHRDPRVANFTASGAMDEVNRLIRNLPQVLNGDNGVPRSESLQEQLGLNPQNFCNLNGEQRIASQGTQLETCYQSYARFCPTLTRVLARFPESVRASMAANTDNLFDNLDGYVNPNKEENEEYKSFNEQICRGRSATPGGPRTDFAQFRRSYCEVHPCTNESRPTILALFLASHPAAQGTDNFNGPAFMKFLSGGLPNAVESSVAEEAVASHRSFEEHISSVHARILKYEEQLPESERMMSAHILSEEPGLKRSMDSLPVHQNPPEVVRAPASSETAEVTGPTPVSAATSTTAVLLPSTGQLPRDLLPSTFSGTETRPTEEENIRREIAGLRKNLSDIQADGADQTVQRIQNLEKQLSDKLNENTDLSSAVPRIARGIPAPALVPDPSFTPAQPFATRAVGPGASAAPTQSSDQGPVFIPMPPSGAFSASSATGASQGLTPRPSSASDLSNSAVLARYELQNTTISPNGSFTIAEPMGKLNLDRLRTAPNRGELILTLASEQVEAIRSKDLQALNRLSEQVRSIRGDIIHVRISSNGNQNLEVFALKTGTTVSFVLDDGSQLSTASRAVASEPARSVPRSSTLTNLKSNLGQ